MISSKILFTKSLGYFLRRRCILNMRIVLVKVGACVLEHKNLMVSPFISPLKTLLGLEEAKWRYWKVLVGLKYVLRSRRLVWENTSPCGCLGRGIVLACLRCSTWI